MEMLGYLAMLVMGVSLGLLGGGGSILTVPILVYIFKTDAVMATAYSLFIVGLTSAVGSFGKYKEGLVNLKVGIAFAIPGFIGVFLARALVIPRLPEKIGAIGEFVISKDILILLTFAVMMILASLSMIKGKKDNSTSKAKDRDMSVGLIALEGLVVGCITGFVGAGGGFLIIPALVVLAKIPMKVAVGTSLMIIAFKSLFGFIGDVLVNPNIEWTLLLILSIISIVGIFLGSYLSRFVPEQRLKKTFGYFVLVMGGFILIQQIQGA